MKLNQIKITNFRSLQDISVDFNGKSTVFFGINGTGKSSLLRAVNLTFAPILNKASEYSRYQQTIRFESEDITYGEEESQIRAEIQIADKNYDLDRTYSNKKGEKTTDYKELTDISEAYTSAYGQNDRSIPIYVSYGINRQVSEVPVGISDRSDTDRYAAYEHAMQSRVDFKDFFEWFRNQEDIENSEKVEQKDLSYRDRSLTAVRTAVKGVLDDCSDIHVERRPRLAMVVEKDGEKLTVSQLSDGEKCTLALFGDLARRLSIANPNLNNPLEGEGIVLIDEVELHMHPSWQRQILGKLTGTFPNIQFIITTHSPLVLSEITSSYNLFSLSSSDNRSIITRVRNLDGFDVNTILETYMKTPHQSSRSEEQRARN